MSDRDLNHDLNDELLSAYLDGELSADQRAAVDARLAVDPAAQQLLHQLRSVSESVQALPQEKLGRDLSDAVLQRVRVVRGSPDPAQRPDRRSPSEAEKVASKIPLFHSTRAWIWASLALAAGLLIMVVQSGDESAKKLPPVAQRSQPNAANQPATIADQPADETPQRARRDLTIAPAPSTSAASSSPPATIAPELQSKEKSDTFAAAKPSELTSGLAQAMPSKPDGPAVATASPAMKDRVELKAQGETYALAGPEGTSLDALAKSPQPAGQINAAGKAFGTATGSVKAKLATPNHRFVVVHVVATLDALKNKSFDQLLEKNSIKFESQPAKSAHLSVAAGNRYAVQQENESVPQQLENKAAEPPAEDLVLVEGPSRTIESFLAALNKDNHDYLRIDVDDGALHKEGAAPIAAAAGKKLADNLRVYSRGAVASEPKDSRSDYDYYYKKLKERSVENSTRDGPYGIETNGQHEALRKEAAAGTDVKAPSNRAFGRASRIDRSEARQLTEKRESGRALGGKVEPAERTPARDKRIEELAKQTAPNDTVKVLFVLSPKDTAAPSAPPADPPK